MLADLFDPAFADSVARIAAPILLASLGVPFVIEQEFST